MLTLFFNPMALRFNALHSSPLELAGNFNISIKKLQRCTDHNSFVSLLFHAICHCKPRSIYRISNVQTCRTICLKSCIYEFRILPRYVFWISPITLVRCQRYATRMQVSEITPSESCSRLIRTSLLKPLINLPHKLKQQYPYTGRAK